MNVFAIYEQFRPLLGEDGAKVFAQALDGLLQEAKDSVKKSDFQTLAESVDRSISRLDAALEKLATAQARTEQRVEELAQAQARTEQRVEELAQAQARTEQRVEELAEGQKRLWEAQARTEKRLEELAHEVSLLAKALRRLAIRTDEHSGIILELQFRDRLASYLGLWLRRARLADVAALIEQVEPMLSSGELEDLTRADLIAEGLLDGTPTFVVGEVSWTADSEDVDRAVRRAAALAKAGLKAVALVACDRLSDKAAAYARSQGARVIRKGRLVA
jgi:chromosome segregation ATPase